MSSYFDEKAREVAQAFEDADDEQGFLLRLVDIERRVYNDVTMLTGDREFPEDIREKALGILATKAVYQPSRLPVPEKALEYATSIGVSRAVEDLHDLFHELAGRRIETRFGRLSDQPVFDRERRDEQDQGR